MAKTILYSDLTIKSKIYTVRDTKVMLDRDLADLYQIETKRLIEQVKRNQDRFVDFMFQLSDDQFAKWRSQFATSNSDKMGLRRAPYAFNEYGILMLASVINSKLAIEINRKVIKIFIELRNLNTSIPILKEKILRMEAEQESTKIAVESLQLYQKLDNKILTDKMTQVSREVNRISTILDEFQDNNIIVKRPETGFENG